MEAVQWSIRFDRRAARDTTVLLGVGHGCDQDSVAATQKVMGTNGLRVKGTATWNIAHASAHTVR
jgi:hypothetical protein